MEMLPLAQTLLDAQVKFMLRDLSGPRLQPFIERGLDDLLARAQRLRLNELVTPDMIKSTVRQYAVNLQLRSAIPEIASAVAHLLHAKIAQKQTRIDAILPSLYVREFFAKSLELQDLRQNTLDEIKDHPIFAQMLTDMLLRRAHTWAREHTPTALQRLWPRLRHGHWPDKTHDLLLHFITTSLQDLCEQLKSLDDQQWLETLLDAWEQIRHRAVGRISDYITPLDVEEFFVIFYQYWQHLRQTDFYSELLDTGVDAFFSVYGEVTLGDLLADLGITRTMMLQDALRFAPPVLRVLRRKKMLEPILREILQPFYASAELQQLLTGVPAP